MTLCARMEFLNLPVASDTIGRFLQAEAAFAKVTGFVSTVAADGLA